MSKCGYCGEMGGTTYNAMHSASCPRYVPSKSRKGVKRKKK